MRASSGLRALVGAIAAAAACAAVGSIVGGDPMAILEVAGGLTFMAWAVVVGMELVRARQAGSTFERYATPAVLHGVACRVTRSLGTDAVVVGALRPRIYVGVHLIDTLSPDELEAVLFHEDHHRRSRAPLRAAALAGWMRLFGRAPAVRGVLLDRLADLETLADADALRRGSTASSLARALLKGEQPLSVPASFSYAANRRVGSLLEHAAGHARPASLRLPYEWLPVVMLAVTAVGCHLGL